MHPHKRALEETDPSYPYPAGAERTDINAACEKFVASLAYKETEKGTALYSRSTKGAPGELTYSAASRLGDNERPGGISVQEAETVVAQFRAALSGAAGLDFRLYRSQEEAFGAGASREAIRARIKGATLPRSRTVLLIAGNLRDLREAWRSSAMRFWLTTVPTFFHRRSKNRS